MRNTLARREVMVDVECVFGVGCGKRAKGRSKSRKDQGQLACFDWTTKGKRGTDAHDVFAFELSLFSHATKTNLSRQSCMGELLCTGLPRYYFAPLAL